MLAEPSVSSACGHGTLKLLMHQCWERADPVLNESAVENSYVFTSAVDTSSDSDTTIVQSTLAPHLRRACMRCTSIRMRTFAPRLGFLIAAT